METLKNLLNLSDSVIAVKDKEDVLKAAEILEKIGITFFSSPESKDRFLKSNKEIKDNFLIQDKDGWRIQSHYLGNGASVDELKEKARKLSGGRILSPRKISKEFTSCNILGLELEHNGMQGGDAGHGGYVKIQIKDLASTSMFLNGEEVEKFEIVFRGDTERDTLVDALKEIVTELEAHKYIK